MDSAGMRVSPKNSGNPVRPTIELSRKSAQHPELVRTKAAADCQTIFRIQVCSELPLTAFSGISARISEAFGGEGDSAVAYGTGI